MQLPITLFLFLLHNHPQSTSATTIRRRIVSGFPANLKQFPWQAILIACPEDAKGCGTCGGSLVSRNFVLTAAHCTDNRTRFDIGLGSIHRFQSAIKIQSRIKIQHPEYNRKGLLNDIALIKLPIDVKLSDAIQIISLASADIGDLAYQTAIVSGFGRTNATNRGSQTLRYIWMKIISNSDCSKFFSGKMIDGKMCAIGRNDTQTVCQGDSGGPLVIKNGESFVQVGIVSFTYRECEQRRPSGYARVSEYINWINENMAK